MRISIRLVATLTAALLIAGCGSAPAAGPAPKPAAATARRMPAWVSLERTEGGQSLSLVTLFEDGRVVFEGVAGDRRRTLAKNIPREQAGKVFAMLETIDFWHRAARYDVE